MPLHVLEVHRFFSLDSRCNRTFEFGPDLFLADPAREEADDEADDDDKQSKDDDEQCGRVRVRIRVATDDLRLLFRAINQRIFRIFLGEFESQLRKICVDPGAKVLDAVEDRHEVAEQEQFLPSEEERQSVEESLHGGQLSPGLVYALNYIFK